MAKGSAETIDWVVDENGEPILRVDYDRIKNERTVFTRKKNRLEPTLTFEQPRGRESTLSFHAQSNEAPDEYLVTSVDDNGYLALQSFNAQSGAISKTIFSVDGYDIDRIIYDPSSAKVKGVRYTDDLPRYHYFSPKTHATQKALQSALGDGFPSIVSTSRDESK